MINGVTGLVSFLLGFLNNLTVFIIALTVLVFVWGVFKLVFSKTDSKERAEAKGYIVWGIVALAVMVSVWGLVNLLISSFGFGNVGPMIPGFPSANII